MEQILIKEVYLSPLFFAIEHRPDPDIVETLLQYGADPNAYEDVKEIGIKYTTPLMAVAEWSKRFADLFEGKGKSMEPLKIAEILLDYGATRA